MIWNYTDMPSKPYKLFLIEANYIKNAENNPVYECAATSKRNAKKEFEKVFSWLDVISVKEAPKDYQPNKWLIERYKKEFPHP